MRNQIVGERFRIGLNGFDRRSLISVETMRRQYIKALSDCFDVCFVNSHTAAEQRLDAVVTYYDPKFWLQPEHPEYPLLFALHGDAVSRPDFLREHLENLQTTDGIIFNCASDKKVLRKMINGQLPNMNRLHFPVDTKIFKKLDKTICRQKLEIDNADFVIGFVGRLIPQKNLHRFLRLFAALKNLLAPKKLVGLVAGKFTKAYRVLDYASGDYENYIKNLQRTLRLENDLFFLGELSFEELSTAYNAMDVLFHPTNNLEEAFGNVPVEAMACGVPVVGAAYGGLKDTIVCGENGYLMPTWITKSGIRTDFLYGLNAVMSVLTNNSLRSKMSELGVERVNALYTYDSFALKLCKAVRHAINRHRDKRDFKKLAVNKNPPLAEQTFFLPKAEKSWDFYSESVSSYVSSDLPELNSNSRLISAGPLINVGRNLYELDDPAFPAKFEILKDQMKILNQCREQKTLFEMLKSGVETHEIGILLESGLLLCSNKEL